MKFPKVRWIILGVIVFGILAMILYSVFHEELVQVQTDKVVRKGLVQKVSAPGKIQPVESVDISAYVPAEITQIYVKEGEEVTKGQKLVDLDSTRYRASLDQARAAVFGAKAQQRLAEAKMLQAERLLNRTKKLFKKQLVGEQELEDAQTAFQVTKASVEASKDTVNQTRAALRLARDDVSKTTLVAPLEGKISRLEKEVGEIVMGSQLTRDIIMTVADLSKMEVIVEVDENDVVDIALGNKVEVEVDALPKEIFKGHLTEIAISPKVKALGTQEETTNFEVTVLLEGDVQKLRPGMNATANIVVKQKDDVLALPIQCVTMRNVAMLKQAEETQKDEEGKNREEGENDESLPPTGRDALKEVVFIYDDGTVKMTEVKTGISSDTEIELQEGVEENAQVVCGPYKTLHRELQDRQEVEIAEPGAMMKEEKKS